MSHILEGLDQSPPSVKSDESEAYSSEPEGSQNGRPHFESVSMHIVMILVHRNMPELVHNSRVSCVSSYSLCNRTFQFTSIGVTASVTSALCFHVHSTSPSGTRTVSPLFSKASTCSKSCSESKGLLSWR